jgi:ATPase family associated with various cellular activities (AAA)
LIQSEHGYRYYDSKKKRYVFDETFMVMQNGCLIEFDTNYCEIYHSGLQEDFINDCTNLMKQFKEKQRRKPLEINLISRGRNGLELKQLEVKRTKLNLDLFYEDDFKTVSDTICKRLTKDKDKGIVLLHGLPGTGKTTYLRYLIGKIKKRVLFVSPNVAADITSPDFIELLVSNPNSVLIIEDAENIIMDRKLNSNASVSNLLNISDGLLADFLNVQLICTFNNSLTLVDSALMRKGRLIAKYEFGKLSATKSQRLSNHLGFNHSITQPMTIAEIANPDEKDNVIERTEVFGFRRQEVTMN